MLHLFTYFVDMDKSVTSITDVNTPNQNIWIILGWYY